MNGDGLFSLQSAYDRKDMGFEAGTSSCPTRRPQGKRPYHSYDTDALLFLFFVALPNWLAKQSY